jgi:integrase
MNQRLSPKHKSRRSQQRSPKEKRSFQTWLLSEKKTIPKESRVSGIYQEGAKFRVVCYCPDRQSFWCKTREEADTVAARLTQMFRDQTERTVFEALKEYLEHRKKEGLRPVSIQNLRDKILPLLASDRLLHTLTPEVAAALYRAETQRISRYHRPVAACTHRASLKYCRSFFRWLVEDRNYLTANPFERVKPVGRENTGKPQLRLDEARTLTGVLLTRAAHDERATAVLTQLFLGVRSGEVLRRQVRDVDNDGKLFWIESGKTQNARRGLEIKSPALQALLAKQVRGRKPDDQLFGAGRKATYSANALWKWLTKFCTAAGVPRVCPHSLRGLHSTLAMEHGATSGLVAAALGHGSFEVTQRHYIAPGLVENLKQRKVSQALESPQSQSSPPGLDALTSILKSLSPEELAHLLRTISTSG